MLQTIFDATVRVLASPSVGDFQVLLIALAALAIAGLALYVATVAIRSLAKRP